MKLSIVILLLAAAMPGRMSAAGVDAPVIEAFSALSPNGPLEGWEPLHFSRIASHTRYSLVGDDGKTVLKASSNASASGLIYRRTFNPNDYPVITWRWKVANVLAKGDVSRKSGDDYAARIYISFAEPHEQQSAFQRIRQTVVQALYGQVPPAAALTYIWANRAPKGSIHPNPYTDRVRMIAVESGTAHLNQWREERRNIVADYEMAFGRPPPPVSGVALMTDSDDTGGSATAWYGDIVFTRE